MIPLFICVDGGPQEILPPVPEKFLFSGKHRRGSLQLMMRPSGCAFICTKAGT